MSVSDSLLPHLGHLGFFILSLKEPINANIPTNTTSISESIRTSMPILLLEKYFLEMLLL